MLIVLDQNKKRYSFYDVMKATGMTSLASIKKYFSNTKFHVNECELNLYEKTIYEENFHVLVAEYKNDEDFFAFEKRMHSNIHFSFSKKNSAENILLPVNVSRIFMSVREDFASLLLAKLKRELVDFDKASYSRKKEDNYPARKLYVKNKIMRKNFNDWLFTKKVAMLLRDDVNTVYLLNKLNASSEFASEIYECIANEKIDFSIPPLSTIFTEREDWLFLQRSAFFNEHTVSILDKLNLLHVEKPIGIKLNGEIKKRKGSNLKINLHENLAFMNGQKNTCLENAGVLVRDSLIEDILDRLTLRSENNISANEKLGIIQKIVLNASLENKEKITQVSPVVKARI